MIISQMKLLLIKKNAIDIEVKGQGHYVIFIYSCTEIRNSLHTLPC